jgi:hypothetical protein
MPLYCKRWKLSDLGLNGSVASAGWQILSICENDQAESCRVQTGIGNMEKQDRAQARSDLQKILTYAETGQKWESRFDEKQCHEAHEFAYKHRRHVIWRFRLSRYLRFYFVYGPDKTLYLIDAGCKRKNRLTQAEKTELEDRVRPLLDAMETNQIVVLE